MLPCSRNIIITLKKQYVKDTTPWVTKEAVIEYEVKKFQV
jgi:hypothetical protein